MLLEGRIHILEERVELRIKGEPIPDGGLSDAGCVLWDCWRRTGVGGFYEWR